MTQPESNSASLSEGESSVVIPEAKIITASEGAVLRRRSRMWWLTGVCVLIAIGTFVWSSLGQGELIQIRFVEGHGLKVGDTMRYRGIDVGIVTRVNLSYDLQGIEVEVRLGHNSSLFAVEGSQFWIERPRLRLGQASGLETVLGAKFIGVVPGDRQGKRQNHFDGLTVPLQYVEEGFWNIRIRFATGDGLESGDPIKYRGMTVGEVVRVELADNLEHVWVSARLSASTLTLARQGTQFWIERPRLDLTEVRGLETLVGGRYIAMQPVNQASPVVNEFIGLAEAPPLIRRDGTLELQLDSPSRFGLVRGAPVSYRGLEVGRVANVALSHDGATVAVQVIVEPEYAELVRENSEWWVSGGIKFEAGLTGLQWSIDSFSTWLRGGVTFATPNNPGARVVTGHTFSLHQAPDSEWLNWQPRIAVGQYAQSADQRFNLPKPIRVAASWKSSWLSFARRRSVHSWGIAVDDGTLWLPSKFASDAEQAGRKVTVEVEGYSFDIELPAILRMGGLARINLPPTISVPTWPRPLFANSWSQKTPLLIVNPELIEPLAIDFQRVRKVDDTLQISSEVPLAPGLAGSAVLDTSNGTIIGLLSETDSGWQIAPPP